MFKFLGRFAIAVQATLGMAIPLAAQPTSGAELLEFVQDVHQASRDAIRTCSCRVEFNGTTPATGSNPPRGQSCSGHFWYSPDAVRAKVTENGREHDYLWKDSVRQSLITQTAGGKRVQGAARGGFANRHFPRCDAWIRGLLVLNVPNTIECVPFEQLVARATRLNSARRHSVAGRETVTVQLFFEQPKSGQGSPWNVEIDFDPAVNYLVRKTVYAYANGAYRREDEVTQFKECAPGLFFPEQLIGHSGPEGKVDFQHTTKISEIRLNQPLPADIFHLRFPHGIYLTDNIRGVRYRVNQEGEPISPEVPIHTGRVTPPPSAAEEPVSSLPEETREEPRPATRWILPISCGILIVGVVGALLRRWRRKADFE